MQEQGIFKDSKTAAGNYVSHNHGILNMAIKIKCFTYKRSPHLVVENNHVVVRKLIVVFIGNNPVRNINICIIFFQGCLFEIQTLSDVREKVLVS